MSLFFPNKLVEIYINERFKIERIVHESGQSSVLIKVINAQVSEVEAKKN